MPNPPDSRIYEALCGRRTRRKFAPLCPLPGNFAGLCAMFATEVDELRRSRAAAAAAADAADAANRVNGKPRKAAAKISKLDEEIKELSVINRYRTRPVYGRIHQWPDGIPPPAPVPESAELGLAAQAHQQQAPPIQSLPTPATGARSTQIDLPTAWQAPMAPATGFRSMPSDVPTVDADAASVIVVMGVCGSGKSTVGKAVAERFGIAFHDADDFHSAANKDKMARGVPLTDEDRAPWLATMAEASSTWSAGAVLACSALKLRYREVLRGGCPAMAFVFLDVPAQVLQKRMAGREHFMPSSLIESQLGALEPPTEDEEGALVVVPRSMASSPVDSVAKFVGDRLAIHRLASRLSL